MADSGHSRSVSLPLITAGGNRMDGDFDDDDDDISGLGGDPYGALQQSSPSSRARDRKPATAAASVGSGGGGLNDMSHLSFRTLGSVPRMPGTTPSLREQLRMARMGANRPMPQVDNARAKTASKQAALSMDVKARMSDLLSGRGSSGTQDRSVIQGLRRENKSLTVQLAAARDEIAKAREEIESLRAELELAQQLQGKGGTSATASASNGVAASPGDAAAGGSGSRPTSASRSGGSTPTPRALTPDGARGSGPGAAGSGGSSSGGGGGGGGGTGTLSRSNSMNNATSVRRSSTARGSLGRSTTNDFAGYRARNNARMARGGGGAAGGNGPPPQLAVKFPWHITELNLDDKSEDQLLLLQVRALRAYQEGVQACA
jgi:hypothetical protein